MLTSLLSLAFAGSAPTLVLPSAVPMDNAEVRLLGRVGGGGWYLGNGIFFNETVDAQVRLSPLIRVGIDVGSSQVVSGSDKGTILSGNVRVQFDLQPGKWNLSPYLVAGTRLQLGLALHRRWNRVQFDASWGYALSTEELIKGTIFRSPTVYMPEIGVTFGLDQVGRHNLRVGMASAFPMVSYRLTLGDTYADIGVGSIVFAHVLAASIGHTFGGQKTANRAAPARAPKAERSRTGSAGFAR